MLGKMERFASRDLLSPSLLNCRFFQSIRRKSVCDKIIMFQRGVTNFRITGIFHGVPFPLISNGLLESYWNSEKSGVL